MEVFGTDWSHQLPPLVPQGFWEGAHLYDRRQSSPVSLSIKKVALAIRNLKTIDLYWCITSQPGFGKVTPVTHKVLRLHLCGYIGKLCYLQWQHDRVISSFFVSWPGKYSISRDDEMSRHGLLQILCCCQLGLAGLPKHVTLTSSISPAHLMVCSHAKYKPAAEPF